MIYEQTGPKTELNELKHNLPLTKRELRRHIVH